MIIPNPVYPGARIGVVAPASSCDPELIQETIDQLCLAGYEPVLGSAIYEQNGFLAGTDEERLYDLHEMFADPTVQAILCVRGGYGSLRIVDQLDYKLIAHNPKWLIGYSDITTLLLAIYQQTGIMTMHGPLLAELPDPLAENCWANLWQRLRNPTMHFTYQSTEEAHCLYPGKTVGPITGGNLSLLAASLGTPFEMETAGHILFIEEVKENPYRIDRMLTQLRLTGKLQAAKGIIFGWFTDCVTPVDRPSVSVFDVLQSHISSLGIPAYIGFPAGHSLPNYSFPIGAPMWMDANKCIASVFPYSHSTY